MHLHIIYTKNKDFILHHNHIDIIYKTAKNIKNFTFTIQGLIYRYNTISTGASALVVYGWTSKKWGFLIATSVVIKNAHFNAGCGRPLAPSGVQRVVPPLFPWRGSLVASAIEDPLLLFVFWYTWHNCHTGIRMHSHWFIYCSNMSFDNNVDSTHSRTLWSKAVSPHV